jgi:non-canonical purine NTP pyrophosphatase (RdgB/HAM1 family)
MMELDGLIFVTSNLGKLREAEAVLGCTLRHRALDIDELQSLDLETVVRHKARSAHARIGEPVMVEDTSLELAGMAGFPGPLVRWLLATVGPAGICRIAHCFGDPRATVRCVVCACNGEDEVLGHGIVHGTIAASPRGQRGFGWDSTFIPDDGDGRTYGQMEESEKNAVSHRRRAFEALRDSLASRDGAPETHATDPGPR